MNKNIKTGAVVGKLGPIQLGHGVIIDTMVKMLGAENSLIVLGSSNANLSLRHFFSYPERRGFIKTIFPNVRIVGIPDYSTDDEWLLALDDILETAGMDPLSTTFFSGCEEDVSFFYEAKRKCHIINRFDGSSVKISSTEIRDCLIYDRSLNGLINPLIETDLRTIFKQKWERFKKI